MSHQQFCLEVVRGTAESQVRVIGLANKNRLAIPKKIDRMAADLMRLTPEEK